MIIQNVELEYCMKCGNKNPSGQEICNCGSRNFVFGNKFTYSKEIGVICDCGNNKFQMTFHMNSNPIYTKNYKCPECGNIIAIQTYCKSSYLD